MELFKSFSYKQALLDILVWNAREAAKELQEIDFLLSQNNSIVNDNIKEKIQSYCKSLNRAYNMKKKLGSSADNIYFECQSKNIFIPLFFTEQKISVMMYPAHIQRLFTLGY